MSALVEIAVFDLRPHDAAAARFDDVAADDLIGGPVGALDEDVGLQLADDRLRRVLVEDHGGIDGRERGNHFGALVFRIDRPRRPLVRTNRSIGIDADDQRIAEGAGSVQIADVTRMEQIEDAVGEDDRLSLASKIADERLCVREREDGHDSHVRNEAHR